MALEHRSGSVAKREGGSSSASASVAGEESPIPSSRDGNADDSEVNNPRPSLPDRNPTSSSRVSSTNWPASNGEPGRIPKNISPSAVFGEGKDQIPMPLDGEIFSAGNSNETYAFANAIDAEQVVSTKTTYGGNPSTSTCSPVDTSCDATNLNECAKNNVDTTYTHSNREPTDKSVHVSVSTSTLKRKAGSISESVSVADFLRQSENPKATFDAYMPSSEPCEPNDNDILLGRGGLSNHHIGNIRYRQYIEDFKPYYQRLNTKDEKKELSQTFMNFVHNYGGRFLEQDPESDGWIEAQNNKARKKCSQALREEKKPRISL
mmetsp:Transcript_36048/g.78952  ORF Transcript_36048/g.78952 Transcript_36048/m.78952 type:complete len:320 (+) Transcript_36048:60-1019(+)